MFCVKHGDYFTEVRAIEAGVPQSCVPGPILYLIYMSDLTTSNELTISTFADDTAILRSHVYPLLATYQLNRYLENSCKRAQK